MRSLALLFWVGKEVVAGAVLVIAAVRPELLATYLHDVIPAVGVVVAAVVSTAGGIAAARFTYGNRARVDEGLDSMKDAATSAADAAGAARLTAAEVRELKQMVVERRRGRAADTGHRRRRKDT